MDRYAPLVRGLAVRYRGLGLPVEDLVQEGSIGVLAAIDDFDPARGPDFASHAYWSARRAILRALTNDSRVVRVPGNVLDRRRIVQRVAAELRAASGQEPSDRAIAAALGVPVPDVATARVDPVGVTSLESGADGATLGDALVDPAAQDPAELVVHAEELGLVARALRHLPERERAIVIGHFGLQGGSETLAQLGARLHLSPQRTRALEQNALYRLAGELEQAGIEHGTHP